MFGFGEAKEHRDAVYEGQHEGKLSHEIVAGGAAFEAMKLFEDRQRKNGMYHYLLDSTRAPANHFCT